MAWTLRALTGLSFGLVCIVGVAGCDDGGGSETTTGATTTTTGGGGELPQGTPIPFMDGWAALTGNTFGIQGSFYTFKDDMDSDNDTVIGMSSITPDSFAGTGTRVCASGTASMVGFETDGTTLAYGDYWGAAIGFNLSQEEGVDAALPYSATANGVIGFSFTIEGTNPIPADGEVRFNIKVAGDDHNYCQPILASGNSTFLLSEMVQDCWLSTAGRPTADATNLEALHWQFVTNADASYMFDLCVTELRAVTM